MRTGVSASGGPGLLAVALTLAIGASGTSPPEPGVGVVRAWAGGLFEVRVAFDRSVDPSVANGAVGRSILFDGRVIKAGTDDLGTLKVAAAKLIDGGRTLVLTTDPHPRVGAYKLELTGLRPAGAAGPGKSVVVGYDLNGSEASWTGGSARWSGWWPGLDPSGSLATLDRSAGHAGLSALLEKHGELTLVTAVTFPAGPVTLRVVSDAPFTSTLAGEGPADAAEGFSRKPAVFRVEASGDPTPLEVVVQTGKTPGLPKVQVTAQDDRDPKAGRPLGHADFSLVWASPPPRKLSPLANVPELSGGDPARGALVFKSAEAKCANCHKVRGDGGTVGPDLSGLVGADPVVVYRDIFEPSARVHPDYLTYTLAMKDGRVLVGTLRADRADSVRLSDTEAKTVVVPRAEIEEVRPSATSIMPVGLVGAIGADKLRDLIAFLTSKPPG